jgi:dienelactone hydrolase
VTTLPVDVQRAAAAEPYELRATPQVQLWYPAQAQPRWPGLSTLLAERLAAHFRAVPFVPAAANAPVAQAAKKFPIVIYFDGWPEDKTQNVNLILELASRGFAVASVIYPGIDRPMLDYSSEAAFERSVQLDHDRARVHARDAGAILDALSGLDARADDRFAHRLDTQHASALGFSFGGAVAAEASRLDPRIQAAINLEGRHWGDALERGVEKPYMYVSGVLELPSAADLASHNPETRFEARLDQVDYSKITENLQALGGIRVTIPTTAHMNFTDSALRSPLHRFSFGGKLDARRVQEIVKSYVVEFLLRYGVPGQPAAFNSPWPRFPEAHVQTWPAPAGQR